ncbi:MAG: hypothetical protein MAG431_02352 [Chloroflexi bacterium]|nr:hypothetical protein [Chloroflexota bacterium]
MSDLDVIRELEKIVGTKLPELKEIKSFNIGFTKNEQRQVTILKKHIIQDDCRLDPEHEFIDNGVSGHYLARPELYRLRDLASERVVEVLYILDVDRLARRYSHQCVLLEELSRCGVKIIFVNQPITGDSSKDKLMANMLGVLAEYERELIRDRMRRGKLHKARQGQVLNTNPAYGYRYIPIDQPGGGRWEVNETEAAVVKNIFTWYVKERLSFRAICRRLNGEEQGFDPIAPRKASRWLSVTVSGILKRKAYIGTTYYNSTQKDPDRQIGTPKERGRGLRVANHRIERPREEWISVTVPQIVPKSLWEQVQTQLEMNKRYASRNNKQNCYLLRSLLVCDECGRILIGRNYASGPRYYCTNRGAKRSLVEPCSCPILAGNIIEPLIWQAVAELLSNPQLILDYYLSRQDENNASPPELKRLRSELEQIEKQDQRLLDAYQADIIQLDELATRRKVLEQQQCILEARVLELEQLLEQRVQQEALATGITEFCDNINSMLQSPTQEQKQQILRLVVDHILVGKDQLIIKHVIPYADDRRLRTRHSHLITLSPHHPITPPPHPLRHIHQSREICYRLPSPFPSNGDLDCLQRANIHTPPTTSAGVTDHRPAILQGNGLHKTNLFSAEAAPRALSIHSDGKAGQALDLLSNMRVKVWQNPPQTTTWAAITNREQLFARPHAEP